MAGHSKWKNIRLRKGKQDAERGKIFTKLSKEIIVAAREGGGQPDTNLRLKIAVQKARASSMPADNIKRAIQRGTGEIEGAQYEELVYEGYGPGGVAVILECFTDNRQRTVPEVRHAFSKCGGNMSESGSVAWQFKQVGIIQVPVEGVNEDRLIDLALEAGAEDVQKEEDIFEVTTTLQSFGGVRQAIDAAGIPIDNAQLSLIPQNSVEVSADDAPKMLRLMEMLEDLDDVQNVYANFDISDEIMQTIDS